jgi:hypothetical protein
LLSLLPVLLLLRPDLPSVHAAFKGIDSVSFDDVSRTPCRAGADVDSSRTPCRAGEGGVTPLSVPGQAATDVATVPARAEGPACEEAKEEAVVEKAAAASECVRRCAAPFAALALA